MFCYQEPAESGECKQAGGTEVYEFNPRIQEMQSSVEGKKSFHFTHVSPAALI